MTTVDEAFEHNLKVFEGLRNTFDALIQCGAIIGRSDDAIVVAMDKVPKYLGEDVVSHLATLMLISGKGATSVFSGSVDEKNRIAMLNFSSMHLEKGSTNSTFTSMAEIQGLVLCIPRLSFEQSRRIEAMHSQENEPIWVPASFVNPF